jgi:hypothetical protein
LVVSPSISEKIFISKATVLESRFEENKYDLETSKNINCIPIVVPLSKNIFN